jgi:hypothetical protein
MNVMRSALFSVVVALGSSSSACASDRSGPSSGTGAPTGLTFRSTLYEGSSGIEGRIVSATPVAAGATITLVLLDGTRSLEFARIDAPNETGTSTSSTGGTEIPFVLEGLKPGRYLVGFAIDTNGDGAVGPGDLAGLHGGTVTAPALLGTAATVIEVPSSRRVGIDVAIGPFRCKGAVGETCDGDADCRGTVCTGQSGVASTTGSGACDPATKKCRLSDCASFGDGAKPSEAGCLGGRR